MSFDKDEVCYKVYVTDSLRGIYKGLGGEVHSRYYDLISGKQIEEERTSEEIIESIRSKLTEV